MNNLWLTKLEFYHVRVSNWRIYQIGWCICFPFIPSFKILNRHIVIILWRYDWVIKVFENFIWFFMKCYIIVFIKFILIYWRLLSWFVYWLFFISKHIIVLKTIMIIWIYNYSTLVNNLNIRWTETTIDTLNLHSIKSIDGPLPWQFLRRRYYILLNPDSI